MASDSTSAQKPKAATGRPALLARITTLEQTVARLESKLQKYEHSPVRGSSWQSFWRSAGVWLLVVLCSLSLLLSAATFWVQRTVLTTDVWVQKTSALLAQPEVRDTVSSMLTKQIFEQADVEAYVATVLPERISGLAGPLTNGLQTTVQGTVNTTLSSEAFADFWANANRSAHQGIMESIANNGAATPEIRQNNVIFLHDNQLVLNLKPVFVGLKDRLVGQGLSFLSGISGERISGQVALAELPQAHRIIAVVNILNRIVGLLPVIAAIAGAGAVALAVRKRRTLMAIGWVTIVLAVVVLQLIAFAQYPFMGALAAANTATSSAVFGIVIADLVTVFRTILILALLMVVAGFLTGPSRPAAYLQGLIGRLVRPGKQNAPLYWIGTNATYIIGGIAGIAVLLIVFPISRSALYMIGVVVAAVVLSFFALSIQKTLQSTRSKNNR